MLLGGSLGGSARTAPLSPSARAAAEYAAPLLSAFVVAGAPDYGASQGFRPSNGQVPPLLLESACPSLPPGPAGQPFLRLDYVAPPPVAAGSGRCTPVRSLGCAFVAGSPPLTGVATPTGPPLVQAYASARPRNRSSSPRPCHNSPVWPSGYAASPSPSLSARTAGLLGSGRSSDRGSVLLSSQRAVPTGSRPTSRTPSRSSAGVSGPLIPKDAGLHCPAPGGLRAPSSAAGERASERSARRAERGVFEVVREVCRDGPRAAGLEREVGELRAELAESEARADDLELRLVEAMRFLEASAHAAPERALWEEERSQLLALAAEREARLETQGAVIEAQRAELAELARAAAEAPALRGPEATPDLRWRPVQPASAEATPLSRQRAVNGADPDPPRGHERAPVAAAVAAATVAAEAPAADFGLSLQRFMPQSSGAALPGPPGGSSSLQVPPLNFLPGEAVSLEEPASASARAAPTAQVAASSSDTPPAESTKVPDWGPNDLLRIGDDPMDRALKRYFEEHEDFKVFTNKLQPGWYTFGKPIQLKVFMKIAAGEAMIRSGGMFRKLTKWLDDYRPGGGGVADGVQGDGADSSRRSASTASQRRSVPQTRRSASGPSSGNVSNRSASRENSKEALTPQRVANGSAGSSAPPPASAAAGGPAAAGLGLSGFGDAASVG